MKIPDRVDIEAMKFAREFVLSKGRNGDYKTIELPQIAEDLEFAKLMYRMVASETSTKGYAMNDALMAEQKRRDADDLEGIQKDDLRTSGMTEKDFYADIHQAYRKATIEYYRAHANEIDPPKEDS